jgi:hypothetical protein
VIDSPFVRVDGSVGAFPLSRALGMFGWQLWEWALNGTSGQCWAGFVARMEVGKESGHWAVECDKCGFDRKAGGIPERVAGDCAADEAGLDARMRGRRYLSWLVSGF